MIISVHQVLYITGKDPSIAFSRYQQIVRKGTEECLFESFIPETNRFT